MVEQVTQVRTDADAFALRHRAHYSPSTPKVEAVLETSLCALKSLARAIPSGFPELNEYLAWVSSVSERDPKIFHDGLWAREKKVTEELKDCEEIKAFALAHTILVRNSYTPVKVSVGEWTVVSIDDGAKIYKAKGQKRGAVGLGITEGALWKYPFVLLALQKGLEETPHSHATTVETELTFVEGVKIHRYPEGSDAPDTDISKPGTWGFTPCRQLHQVDSSGLPDEVGCFGCTVAFPGSVLDRSEDPVEHGMKEVPHIVKQFSTGPREQVKWNFLHMKDEGTFMQIHVNAEPGEVLGLGGFPQRNSGTVVCAILCGGKFQVSDGIKTTEVEGDSLLLTDGKPLQIRCISAIPGIKPPQVSFAVVLPYEFDLMDLESEGLRQQIGIHN